VKKTAHPILRKLGESVRVLRVHRGLSQEALAELAGIDRSYMSGIERGLRNLSILHAVKLASALEIAPHELLKLSVGPITLENTAAMPVPVEPAAQLDADRFSPIMRLRRARPVLIADEVRTDPTTNWRVGQYLSLG
jgi:transcriptional regulator with XRE-family HTH domain